MLMMTDTVVADEGILLEVTCWNAVRARRWG